MSELPNHVPENPLVSVIVTTYNHGPYIEQCLESLVAQETEYPYEILVGEDCSQDDTREKVVRLAEKYPDKMRAFLNEKNLKRGNSPNLRRNARGKYLALCEGDDFWHRTDKLQIQVKVLENDPEVSVVCSGVDALFQETGRLIKAVDRRTGAWTGHYPDITKAILLRDIGVQTCSAVTRKSHVDHIRDNNPYEFSSQWPMGDIQTWLELSRLGKIVHMDESLATYRVMADSASRSSDPDKLLDFNEKCLQILLHYVEKFGYEDEVRRRLIWRYFRAVAGIARQSGSDRHRIWCEEFLIRYPAQSPDFNNSWLAWSVSTPFNFTITRALYPPYALLKKTEKRIRTNLSKLTHNKHRL